MGSVKVKNRLCIFSFFDKEGYVDEYVTYLLAELSACVKRLIIVVNGALDERGQRLFKQYTQEVYIRDNIGYDAGAYKDVLCNKLSEEDISFFDEIVLCNDTFFGPFIPLINIFEQMRSVDCDMWGLNGYFDSIYPHAQSYFLVFRDKIISNKLLIDYFEKNVDEKTTNINHVYCQFENGLYDYMVRQNGMKCAKYIGENHNYDLYKFSYGYLQELQLPILKRKVFGYIDEAPENAICSLSYIKHSTDYDIEMVLKCIERIYKIAISSEEIKPMECYKQPKVWTLEVQRKGVSQVEDFIRDEEFYIYGAGIYGCNTYWRFARGNDKFCGFIVSDNSKDANTLLFGYPVVKFSDIGEISSKKVILAMKSEFAEEVLKQFPDVSNVMRIF